MKKIVFSLFFVFFHLFVIAQKSPGGITGAHAWLTTSHKQGFYFEWEDKACDSVVVFTNGSATPYSSNYYRYVNFNPALYVDIAGYQRYVLKRTNLSQATIINFFMPYDNFTEEFSLYGVSGRPKEGFLVTSDQIYHGKDSDENSLDYGSDQGRDLRYKSEDTNEVNLTRFKETSARVLSYLRYTSPNYSVWGEPSKATIVTGNLGYGVNKIDTDFSKAVNGCSSFYGYLGESIVYDRVLTPLEREKVETYLALKYGVTLNKSYISSWDTKLWDISEHKNYNNRIVGLIRDDASDLHQADATTTYEESTKYNYYSYLHHTYEGVEAKPWLKDHLPYTKNRLLVMGLEYTSDLLSVDRRYAIFGDNNKSIKAKEISEETLYRMDRVWKLKTNFPKVVSKDTTLTWQIDNIDVHGGNWDKDITITSNNQGGMLTAIPLKGKDGSLFYSGKSKLNHVTIKFGTKNLFIKEGAHDYGVSIYNGNQMYSVVNGVVKEFICYIDDNDSFEVIKQGNLIRFKKNEALLNYTIKIAEEDLDKAFYGSICLGKYKWCNEGVLTHFTHRGFVEDGARIELSYLKGMAKDFDPYALYKKGYKPYLIINKKGGDNFDNPDDLVYVPFNEVYNNRSKLTFSNLFFDQDGSGEDSFTFGFKKQDAILAYVTVKDATCDAWSNSLLDGSVSAKIEGGKAPFTYRLIGMDSINATYDSKLVAVNNKTFTIASLASGNYSLRITDSSEQIEDFKQEVFVAKECEDKNTEGPKEVTEALLTLYPNPAKARTDFNIRLNTPERLDLYLLEMTGKFIDHKRIAPPSNGKYQVIQAYLNSPGTYLVKAVTTSGKVLHQKIIIQ